MCGLVGVLNQEHLAAPDIYVALMAMQHRGKESARIVTASQGKLMPCGGMGEVAQAFSTLSMEAVPGTMGIGHVRYSTTGESSPENIQPLKGSFRGHDFYLAHNGNLVNTKALKAVLGWDGGSEASDTRVIVEMIAVSRAAAFEEALLETAAKLRGAFNLILLFENRIYALRDPFGFHPFQLGASSGNYVVASESHVFGLLGANLIRDIKNGEMLVIDQRGCENYQWAREPQLKFDIFEYIYFCHPGSTVHNANVGQARIWMGRFLAQEQPVEADVVMPVPDSGNFAASGYHRQRVEDGSKMRYEPYGLLRSHFAGRTFIEPVKERRKDYLPWLKHTPQSEVIRGQRVLLVDDSIVRGKTSRAISKMLLAAGAREVSWVVSSPMYLYPDFYGIDTYRERDELIAKQLNGDIAALKRNHGNLTHLGYLSLAATIQAVLKAAEPTTDLTKESFYTGPFTGDYPAGRGDFDNN